ncbi:hypothetical protein E2562_000291 [Oryza meyeriana var. granulata]|uniref:Uncharacterized protein n=1 Tax=Oryza meyeriana var. granulata TaxID=110450 RepID=A0A6G1CMR2_9ORYZ|nr:hypothetical protein E2562_000291 [Oryza meyeriana var. granulata]
MDFGEVDCHKARSQANDAKAEGNNIKHGFDMLESVECNLKSSSLRESLKFLISKKSGPS